MRKEFKNVYVEKRLAELKFEENVLLKIRALFKDAVGVDNGVSDEDILHEVFGKRKYAVEEVKLVKKLRGKYQKEDMLLVGKVLSDGRFVRFRPNTEFEAKEYVGKWFNQGVSLIKRMGLKQKQCGMLVDYDWKQSNRSILGEKIKDLQLYYDKLDSDDDAGKNNN